ncbi:SGNH/GDSL hydrolase family protein [Streptomyces monticola]|uniref:SGNH/GDSL hydrolase family protein n=1 Tax=Streptomyces monticola TaxID=2666263 RepID=A0ABW2JAP6_9ACTN
MGGPYLRYVALGDSQTEGVGDGDDLTGLRGWADRLAERLGGLDSGVLYANLAVRGRLAGQVRAEQVAPALALRPDLVTVVAGVNDVLRPRFDADEVGAELEAMFAAFTGAGACVATVTLPDMGRLVPLARPLAGRVLALNSRVREAASRHGVVVTEAEAYAEALTDPRLWSPDRLQRIAAAFAHALGLPGSDDSWTRPLPPPAVPVPAGRRAAAAEARWAAAFLGPWLGRRLKGRSSGEGRVAKRPQFAPAAARP